LILGGIGSVIRSEVAIVPHSDPNPPPARGSRPRVAVLLSGSGRTLEYLLAATGDGRLDVDVVAVVGSRAGVRGVEVARAAGCP
jgi:formyltetrahydrofolate hydrolase